MNKFFLMVALSLSVMGAAQAQKANGHFSMRYPGGVAETNLEAFCRTQLPRLCEGTTFEVTREHVDQQGYRHVTMQQYVRGVRANGMTLNVHVFEGKITSINGTVLTQEMVPAETMKRAPRPAAEVLEMSGLSERLAEKAELVLYNKDGVSHLCYFVLDGDKYKHLDAFTGEVIAEISIYRHAVTNQEPQAVKGVGQTMFSGVQDIDIAYQNGAYTLTDLARKITTLNASQQVFDKNGFREAGELSYDQYIGFADPFTNDSPNWLDPTYHSYLKDFVFQTEDPSCYGKYVGAVLTFSDFSEDCTDPVLVVSHDTKLSLPYVLDHEEEKEVVGVEVYLIDPETKESTRVGGYNDLPKGSNMKWIELDQFSQLAAYNYFEGYAPVLDIHWGIAQVWDFYKDVFGYNSFDGQGTEVFCLVNPADTIFPAENACAVLMEDGLPGLMMYGMGGPDLYPVVDFTVTGHEFTHLVARKLNAYELDNALHQPHALNESFADIMGLSIYRHVFGKEIWGIGPNVMRNNAPLRRIDEPEANVYIDGSPMPSPSCFLDDNFDTVYFEEHQNSTVQSHMFYLLVTGGEGINSLGDSYEVTPMDRDEAERLAFTTLTEYVDTQINYEEVPDAWITAAIQLFGENSAQLRSLCQAWGAVGLPQGNIVAIEQLQQDNSQKRGLRYNLQGQPVGADYTGIVVEG